MNDLINDLPEWARELSSRSHIELVRRARRYWHELKNRTTFKHFRHFYFIVVELGVEAGKVGDGFSLDLLDGLAHAAFRHYKAAA